MIYLNLGCGAHVAPPPWVNVDCSYGTAGFPNFPDVICDIRTLPWHDDEVDAVYAGHVLEHLPMDDVVPALREIRRVLKEDGRFFVVGPDFDRATTMAAAGLDDMRAAIWPGAMDNEPWASWEGAGHQWCATATNTLQLVRQIFRDAVELPITEVDDFWPAPSRTELWQFAIAATP